MKSSRYNLFIPAGSGRTVLFNTLYGSVSVLEEDEYAEATAILNGTQPGALTRKLYTQFSAQKHLIADEVDEFAILENRKRAGINDSNTLEVIVLPTLNCNFRCVYCYEDHIPSKMSPDTVAALKKWLQAEIPLHKLVMLHWFGGEPLLEYGTVLSVSRHVKTITEQCGTLSVLHMTTNGYLLTATRAKELIAAGIHDYQITLDGPPRTHDTLRVMQSGRGTFKRVFENVCMLATTNQHVKISLRVNFNHTNIDSISELLDMFPSSLRGQMRVVFEPIFGDRALSAICNITPATISGKLAQLSEKAAEMGYDTVFGISAVHPGKLVYCYAERQSQYMFNFDGNVFKCSVCDFKPEHCVGQLGPDGLVHKDEVEWQKWTDGELFAHKCRSCAYLPLCMGGCRKRQKDTDSSEECTLVATNASYLLKHIALGSLGAVFNRV